MPDQPINWDDLIKSSAPIMQEGDEHCIASAAVDAEVVFEDLNKDAGITLNRFTQEQAKYITGYLTRLRKLGSAGIALICAGDDCEYRHACPLWQIKDGPPVQMKDPKDSNKSIYIQKTKAPVGHSCPLESAVIMDCYAGYTSHSAVDMSNPVHVNYIRELCAIGSAEWRINMLLAYSSHGMQVEVPAAVSVDGVVYTRPAINELVDLLDRLSKRRSKILDSLTINPSIEYKRKIAETKDKSPDSHAIVQSQRKAAIERARKGVMEIPDHVKNSEIYKEAHKDNEKE